MSNAPDSPPLALTGSCLCGAIAYELRSSPKAVSHCHCRICQKAHGAAFATYGSVPAKDLVFTQGQEQPWEETVAQTLGDLGEGSAASDRPRESKGERK